MGELNWSLKLKDGKKNQSVELIKIIYELEVAD